MRKDKINGIINISQVKDKLFCKNEFCQITGDIESNI